MTSSIKRLATLAPFFLLAALSACGSNKNGTNATASNSHPAMTEVAHIRAPTVEWVRSWAPRTLPEAS